MDHAVYSMYSCKMLGSHCPLGRSEHGISFYAGWWNMSRGPCHRWNMAAEWLVVIGLKWMALPLSEVLLGLWMFVQFCMKGYVYIYWTSRIFRSLSTQQTKDFNRFAPHVFKKNATYDVETPNASFVFFFEMRSTEGCLPGKQPLLLISINFTPKNSLTVARKNCTFLCFPGGGVSGDPFKRQTQKIMGI